MGFRQYLQENKEYAIWGITPKGSSEQLLLAKFEGKPITDKKEAKKLLDALKKKHGIKKGRIQEIDLSTNPKFDEVFN